MDEIETNFQASYRRRGLDGGDVMKYTHNEGETLFGTQI